MTESLVEIADNPDILGRLSNNERAHVVSRGRLRVYAPGELVFEQGGHHDGIFVIRGGLVRSFYIGANGREITLAYWRPGNLVGTPEVLREGGVHLWSGEAVIATQVLVLKTSTLRSLIAEIPQLALAVIEALEYKGKCFSGMVQMLGTMTVSERILEALRTLADVYGTEEEDGIVLRAPFTHEAIANMVGASRQWVTMELHALEKKGIVRVSNRAIVVRAPERLKA